MILPGQYLHTGDFSLSEGIGVTAEQFEAWLKEMGISGAAAARMLGVSPNTVVRYKRHGGPKVLELACLALWHRLDRSPLIWQDD